MQQYITAVEYVNKCVKYVASIMFVALAVLVFFQVITRFVINFPLAWSEEISRYLTIYIVFLGSALAVRNKEHIAIDFLFDIVSAAKKKKLQLIVSIISTVFFIILCYYGTVLTITVIGQVTPTLQFSIAWVYAAVPIGSFVMALNSIANILNSAIGNENAAGGETP
ncbi:TRAP transporter small permease [Salibacterium halotolerans]|uniref:TRAP-type C4-dicarboxylate transport system, small permease component n=1 Tax=Salibacterium halotolerans TaxID=1884432 RepID=A0A1I5KY46_9BACI|nr:TRAP transporter small permease [Salibacterium halotolerans]SFO89965.1 TRAP-type C4-dicarboxylate transport system, small permease component [Salibacterium halotolerans]